MSARAIRLALLATLCGLAAAALPGAASASIAPALTLNQSAGTTAGSLVALGVDLKFTPSSGDMVRDVSLALPAGLIPNAGLDNGGCLTTATPDANCLIGSGTATTASGPQPFSVYLVQGPQPGDVAGAALAIGPIPLGTGEITLRNQPDVGLNIALPSLPASDGVSELNFSLTSVRLPSSCPVTPAGVTLTADSQLAPGTPTTASAPLSVTGCATEPYAPMLSAAVTKDARGNGASAVLAVAQAANTSASRSLELDIPSSLSPNLTAAAGCLGGSSCVIGAASAVSPLLPASALRKGTLSLGGSVAAPSFMISFPAPFALSVRGVANLLSGSVTFSLPDLPLTSLTLSIAGTTGGKLFNTDCRPSKITGRFTPWSGRPVLTATRSVIYRGCPLSPTASGALTGIAGGKPALTLKLKRATLGADVTSLSIGLPRGLRFKAIRSGDSLIGLVLTGARVKRASVSRGRLAIVLRKPAAAGFSVAIGAKLLSATSAIQSKAKKHRLGTLKISVKLTGADHRTLPVTVSVLVRSRRGAGGMVKRPISVSRRVMTGPLEPDDARGAGPLSVPRHRLRASDADREQTAARLRHAASEGRLFTEELEERLGAVLSARTYGELDRLVADLPATPAVETLDDPRDSSLRWTVVLAAAFLIAILLMAGALGVGLEHSMSVSGASPTAVGIGGP